MDTKLFNQDPDGLMSQVSLGGVPIFTEDLQMIQDNSTELYGMLSLLKGWACTLRGCLVDKVNINNNTIKVLPGIVILNDKLYEFPGYEGTYPFSIVPTGPTYIDTRIFKDGNAVDVATSYGVAIRTNFTPGSNDGTLNGTMPTDLSTNEIYFNPFTAQRSEYIIANASKMRQEIKQLWKGSSFSKTETGRDMDGGSLSFVVGDSCRWKYLGWTNFESSDQFVLRNKGNSQSERSSDGSNVIKLTKGNLPEHQHSEDNAAYGGTLTAIELSSDHSHFLAASDGTKASAAEFGSETVDSGGGAIVNGSEFKEINKTMNDGKHSHYIAGKTGRRDDTWGGTPDAFSTKSYSLYCLTIEFYGYGSIDFPAFFTGTLPYTNM